MSDKRSGWNSGEPGSPGGPNGNAARRAGPDPGPLAGVPAAPAGGFAERRLSTFDRLGQTLVATLTVAALSGQDATDLSVDLLTHMKAEGDQPASRHVVLDLQNVQFMDSACIGSLVELFTRLQQAGGRIALVNAAHNVEYLFKLTRLDRLFPICRDVMKAIDVLERAG